MIDEEEFPSGKVRVTVLWDEWKDITLEERTAAVLRAYELAQDDTRQRIALASGLTLPEAYAAGMLPFRITPHLRREDVVTQEDCRRAMIDEGASTLVQTMTTPLLAFARRDEAEAARDRLARRLPASDQAWVITEDVGRVEDAVER